MTVWFPRRVVPYRKGFASESSKTFHFFWATLVPKGRIFNSHHLYRRDVRQVYQIPVSEIPSLFPPAALCCALAT